MIKNAKDIPLCRQTGTLPNLSNALMNWFQPISFVNITKTVQNFKLVETSLSVDTKGVRQPMSAKQLEIRPEGERAWNWQTLHCLPDFKPDVDSIIIWEGCKYRVMQVWNYSEYGYNEIHMVEDYKTE